MKNLKLLTGSLRIQKSKILSVFLTAVIVLALVESTIISPAYSQPPTRSAELISMFRNVLSNIDEEEIMRHIAFFTSCGSRVTGYPGFFNAVDYVVSEFKSYGIQPYGDDGYFEHFDITVPVDYGAKIVLENGETIKGYNLWPNLVNPSPYKSPSEGDTLVYVGKGDFDDLSKVNVTGRIVLMDFDDSRWFFRLAMMFGAKGVVYIGSGRESRMEAFQKLYNLPVAFPRIYLKPEDGLRLKELCEKNGEVKIWIDSLMKWENIRVPNIVGFINGTTNPKEICVLTAYLDSWSIVPALAPGATDALGVSALLNLAKLLAQNPPKRSVMFVVFAGHWQSLWGAREWVDKHFGMFRNVKFFVSLDLSAGSQQLAVYNRGNVYSYTNIQVLNGRYTQLISLLFQTYLPALKEILGARYGEYFLDQILLTYPPWISACPPTEFMGATYFDSEPYVAACYGGGFAFHTTNDVRHFMKTPADTFDKIQWENYWPQVQFIFASLYALLNEPRIDLPQSPSRMEATGEWGYCRLTIKVVSYNMTTAYWDPFDESRHPEAIDDLVVHYQSASAPALTAVPSYAAFGAAFLAGILDVVVKPNRNGEVVIKGVKPYTGGTVNAFVVNSTNGHIEWATDVGVWSPYQSNYASVTTIDASYLVSIFRCSSIVLFALFNPSDLSSMPSLALYNRLAHGPLIQQSALASPYGDVMGFVMPNTPVEILVMRGRAYGAAAGGGGGGGVAIGTFGFIGAAFGGGGAGGRFPMGLLLNSTPENPAGYGYTVKPGETLVIPFTPLIYARDIYMMNDGRVRLAAQYYTFNPVTIMFHKLATQYLNQAIKAVRMRDYGLSYAAAYASWAYEQQAYYSMMDLIWQVIYTIVVISIAVIPFAYAISRLVGFEKRKLLASTIIVFGIMLIVLNTFHPGFHLATNAGMAILAFGTAIVILPLLGFVVREAMMSAKTLKEKMVGMHTAEISRSAIAFQAFSLSISNMRRRRFMTGLTLTSVIILVFSMVTFTSLMAAPRPVEDVRVISEGEEPPLYQGILIRRPVWSAIPEEMYYQIINQFKDTGICSARGWLFPPPPQRGLGYFAFSDKLITKVGAVLFLSPEEKEISHIDEILLPGSDWFGPDDVYTCLISKTIADNLTKELGREITIGSTLPFLGMELRVIGIFDGDLLWSGSTGIVDLDGEPITPLMPLITTGAGRAVPFHFPGSQIMIMPLKACLLLRERAYIVSIAYKPYDTAIIRDVARNLALRIATDIYYSDASNKFGIVRYRQWFTITGFETFILPTIICSFTILNMMLANVYYRTREISIYMAVGLSPLHVSTLFLAESLVYALLGAVMGYVYGVIGCWLFASSNMYPEGFYPNFSSFYVFIVLGSTSLVTILSTVYPSIKASRLVTPSLERKWKVPPPRGDEWEIKMPFVFSGREIYGFLAFVHEYFDAHRTEGVGAFATFGDIEWKSEENIAEDKDLKLLTANVRLAPFDVGITQQVSLIAESHRKRPYGLTLYLRRTTGLLSDWVNSNRPFIDSMRKQLLIWRTLKTDVKEKYIETGLEIFKKKGFISPEEFKKGSI